MHPSLDCCTAFLLGLVGSLHCAGMCGPLALALPATGSTTAAHVLGRIAYNAGRIATYCLLGILFGLVGYTLLLAGFQRWVSITLGVALLLGLVASRLYERMADDSVEAVIALDMDTGGGLVRTHPALVPLDESAGSLATAFHPASAFAAG